MFKKIISCLIILVMMTSLCLAAKPGDVAGNYYYTDIKTYLRGQLLDSYNVGGKTVILCEALKDYGFIVNWNGAERKLTVTDTKGEAISNATGSATGTLGAVAGNYYHTDIVTVFNGSVIESYNIGGQTVIPATDLRALGYVVEWDEANRRVLIDTNKSAFVTGRERITNVTIKQQQTHHGNFLLRTDAPTFNGYLMVTENDCFIESSLDKKSYIPFEAFADCLGIAYSWDSATSTIMVKVPADKDIKLKEQKYKTNLKTYGTIEHQIYDIEMNFVNGQKTFNNVEAIVYGDQVFIEANGLAKALGFFCMNYIDFYTETFAYYMYQGVFQ